MRQQFVQQPGQTIAGYLTPTEQIKRDVIQLAKEATDHLSKSLNSENEKWAFYVKTRVLSLRLKNFMSTKLRIWLRDQLVDLEHKVDKIESDESLGPDNKKINMVNMRYEYALGIYDVCVELLHNCPIVESRADAVVELDIENIENRIRKKVDNKTYGDQEKESKPIRKNKSELEGAFDIEQVVEEDTEEGYELEGEEING